MKYTIIIIIVKLIQWREMTKKTRAAIKSSSSSPPPSSSPAATDYAESPAAPHRSGTLVMVRGGRGATCSRVCVCTRQVNARARACVCVRACGTCCGRPRLRANGVRPARRRRGRRCSERLVCQWTIVQTGTSARIVAVPNQRARRTTVVTHHR